MYLYVIWFILAVIALAEVILSSIKHRNTIVYRFVYLFVIFIFLLLSSLRWETGTDWDSYYNFFISFDKITFISWFEPGYTFLSSFISNITRGIYTILLFLMAVIILFLKSSMIRRYSIYPFLSILVWWSIYLADIFPVRQTIATALSLYSIRYIVEQKKVKYILMVCLAMTFHVTAFIFLFAYFVFYLKTNIKILISSLLLAYLVAFFANNMTSALLNHIGLGFIEKKLEFYIGLGEDQTFGGLYTASQILILGLFSKLFLFIPIFTYVWKTYSKDVLFRGWINLFVFGTTIGVCLTPISGVLGRLAMYYDVTIQIFIIPYFLNVKMTQLSRLIVFVILAIYLFTRFSGVVANYESYYIPYKSICY